MNTCTKRERKSSKDMMTRINHAHVSSRAVKAACDKSIWLQTPPMCPITNKNYEFKTFKYTFDISFCERCEFSKSMGKVNINVILG